MAAALHSTISGTILSEISGITLSSILGTILRGIVWSILETTLWPTRPCNLQIVLNKIWNNLSTLSILRHMYLFASTTEVARVAHSIPCVCASKNLHPDNIARIKNRTSRQGVFALSADISRDALLTHNFEYIRAFAFDIPKCFIGICNLKTALIDYRFR